MIALIVTVIVLLILAGVAIVTLTGENGILNRARLAKEKTNAAQEEEQNRLDDYEEQIETLGRAGSKSLNYSTEEQVVGTWIDGKPLYQKTVSNLNVSPTWNGTAYAEANNINLGISNIGRIISANSLSSDGSKMMPLCVSVKTNGYVDIRCTVTWDIKYITIQYTKTTD